MFLQPLGLKDSRAPVREDDVNTIAYGVGDSAHAEARVLDEIPGGECRVAGGLRATTDDCGRRRLNLTHARWSSQLVVGLRREWKAPQVPEQAQRASLRDIGVVAKASS